jgi:hypothetical protein
MSIFRVCTGRYPSFMVSSRLVNYPERYSRTRRLFWWATVPLRLWRLPPELMESQ